MAATQNTIFPGMRARAQRAAANAAELMERQMRAGEEYEAHERPLVEAWPMQRIEEVNARLTATCMFPAAITVTRLVGPATKARFGGMSSSVPLRAWQDAVGHAPQGYNVISSLAGGSGGGGGGGLAGGSYHGNSSSADTGAFNSHGWGTHSWEHAGAPGLSGGGQDGATMRYLRPGQVAALPSMLQSYADALQRAHDAGARAAASTYGLRTTGGPKTLTQELAEAPLTTADPAAHELRGALVSTAAAWQSGAVTSTVANELGSVFGKLSRAAPGFDLNVLTELSGVATQLRISLDSTPKTGPVVHVRRVLDQIKNLLTREIAARRAGVGPAGRPAGPAEGAVGTLPGQQQQPPPPPPGTPQDPLLPMADAPPGYPPPDDDARSWASALSEPAEDFAARAARMRAARDVYNTPAARAAREALDAATQRTMTAQALSGVRPLVAERATPAVVAAHLRTGANGTQPATATAEADEAAEAAEAADAAPALARMAQLLEGIDEPRPAQAQTQRNLEAEYAQEAEDERADAPAGDHAARPATPPGSAHGAPSRGSPGTPAAVPVGVATAPKSAPKSKSQKKRAKKAAAATAAAASPAAAPPAGQPAAAPPAQRGRPATRAQAGQPARAPAGQAARPAAATRPATRSQSHAPATGKGLPPGGRLLFARRLPGRGLAGGSGRGPLAALPKDLTRAKLGQRLAARILREVDREKQRTETMFPRAYNDARETEYQLGEEGTAENNPAPGVPDAEREYTDFAVNNTLRHLGAAATAALIDAASYRTRAGPPYIPLRVALPYMNTLNRYGEAPWPEVLRELERLRPGAYDPHLGPQRLMPIADALARRTVARAIVARSHRPRARAKVRPIKGPSFTVGVEGRTVAKRRRIEGDEADL